MLTEKICTLFFAIALIHTFAVSFFAKLAHKFPKGSGREVFFHLLSEVEVVFGFWAFIFLSLWALWGGLDPVIKYQQSLNLTEPMFIFCIMIMASTRPVLVVARAAILFLSQLLEKLLKLTKVQVQFLVLMTLGPLLGSFITEPAAMTIVALLLYRMIDIKTISTNFLYAIVGLLFVNVSVGGALTHFAAPPILVVARTWGWSLGDVFVKLGEASVASVFISTFFILFLYKDEIKNTLTPIEVDHYRMPHWVIAVHLVFMAAVVATAHYSQVFFGLFLIFLGVVHVTQQFQDQLKFREAFLVGFFLSGLIVFGSMQRWWLEPLLSSLNQYTLYFGAIGLTAITDNAALTYLGSQVPNLPELSRWALVGGALVGGGITILANAPNPAGFSILSSKFSDGSLNAFRLAKAAFIPTCVAAVVFFIKIFLF